MEPFSIRAYAESMRDKTVQKMGPFAFLVRDRPPLEVRSFRWWEDEQVAAPRASQEAAAAVADEEMEEAAEEDEEMEGAEEEEPLAPGRGRAPKKKRSISDLIAEAPSVDPSGSRGAAWAGEDDEMLGEIVRRAKEMKRQRRVEAEAARAVTVTTAPAEPSSAGGTREKAVDEKNLQDEPGIPESSEVAEPDQNISSSQKKVPDPKEKKHGKISNFQKNKADKLKYTESRKAIKVGKQRELEKMLPLHSILKKYTKLTTVKMVKDKHRNPKRSGVIELCRKSVKRVKFSEANDVHGSNKQSSKMPQMENLCKFFSDAMTSSSSTDMSSEGDRHTAAESSSSHKPEKAYTKAEEANENTDHENSCKVSNSGSSELFDLNVSLPESTDLNDPYTSNSEVPSVEHTQDGVFSIDEQTLDNGRENQKHVIDLDIRAKDKSPDALPNRTIHDSVQLRESWSSMTLHRGVSQLSSGGDLHSCQFGGLDQSRSRKPNFHSEMSTQRERLPAVGQTFRLMGKDVTVSTTRVSYLAETSQKHTGTSDKDNLNAKMVLGLPRKGQPFLSLQAPSIPIGSVNTASTVHDSANPASKIQAQFGYRTPYNFSQPLPTGNLFSLDPPQYEDRFRKSVNSESRRNVLLGCPSVPSTGTEAFQQSSRGPWHCYSDHSTRTESPSEPCVPAIKRHALQSSDYHADVSQPHCVYPSISSVHSHKYGSFTLSNPKWTVQGVPDSRVSSALPSRYADNGAGAVRENFNASSSSRQELRSGPVKLSAGAKHLLMPSESTVEDNAAPLYSRVSFGCSNRNVSASRGKGEDFHKF